MLGPTLALCLLAAPASAAAATTFDVAAFDRARVLKAADAYLSEKPVTVTASGSPRSKGGPHDYFSEGDYWWPDPKNPGGPYIRKDGQSNPENFEGHRKAMRRLSVQVPALAAAWKLTKDHKYADHAVAHLRAWFVDPETMMNPNLDYSQAIFGRDNGRATGVIDTLHLVEVAKAVEVLQATGALADKDKAGIVAWFAKYLDWLTTSKFGTEEREAGNNHGTCWAVQAAAFARVTGNPEVLAFVRKRFKDVFVPNQMNNTGAFPQELIRTKPYGYSLFNLDAMTAVAELASTPEDDLWKFERAEDGRGLRVAVAWMYPYIKDKTTWRLPPDVQWFEYWPMRHHSLLFAGRHYDKTEYIELWKTLPADSDVDEVIRNFFIRQPVLWVD
jgi:hypothetical protein